MELIELCEALEATYRSFVNEFLEKQEPLIPTVLEYDARDFGSLIRRLRNDAQGIGLLKDMCRPRAFG